MNKFYYHLGIINICALLCVHLSCNAPNESPTTGMIQGTVLDAVTSNPINDVLITTDPVTSSKTTDNEGGFIIEDVEPGVYIIQASKSEYITDTTTVHVVVGRISSLDIKLHHWVWVKEHENPPTPEITAMIPAEGAVAGVNVITIIGENFSDQRNLVYFNNVQAEIIESSSTEITVRRPNLVSDSSVVNSTVKVVSYDALLVATYSDPYPIFAVVERYGNFIENRTLGAITTDGDNNLYVVESAPYNVFKITPSGDRSLIGVAGGSVYDIKMSPAGKLILLFNRKEIHQVDPDAAVDTATVWTEVTKRVKYGDFDENRNFYAAAKSSDLICVKPDLTSRQLGFYSSDEIFCVQVLNNDVYVLVELDDGEPVMGVWRHEILDKEGTLGERELVLDWAHTGAFTDAAPSSFTFDEYGNMYIGTEDLYNPLMVMYTNGDLDIYYKDIIPGPAKQIAWSAGTHLFMILDGDDEKTVLRIDMGVQGAPHFRG